MDTEQALILLKEVYGLKDITEREAKMFCLGWDRAALYYVEYMADRLSK